MKSILFNILFYVSTFALLSFSNCNHDKYDEPDNPAEDKGYVVSGSLEGHDYVDLGLSVKWATCNISALKNEPANIGQYFSWGVTTHQTYFSWADYIYWTDINGDGYFSYEELTDIGKEISGTKYDVASKRWGGGWRMPTKDEMEELITKCKITVTTRDDTFGFKLQGPNGNCIFLPAAGYWRQREIQSLNSGHYWTSTRCPDPDDDRAWYGSIGKNGYGRIYWSERKNGLPVRAVCD